MIEGYFDGCCEPVNPGGIASYGAVILRDGQRIWEESRIFRPAKGREKTTSNNLAEYSGFQAILLYLLDEGINEEEITIFGDSQLVIRQMNGEWKIRHGFYIQIAYRCRELLTRFPSISLQWIPREKNSLADKLSKAQLIKAGVEFRIQPHGKKKKEKNQKADRWASDPTMEPSYEGVVHFEGGKLIHRPGFFRKKKLPGCE